MRIHTGERPFQCTVCQAQFTVRGNLSRRLRVHSGHHKLFECKQCDRAFTSNSNLMRHEQQMHQTSTQKESRDIDAECNGVNDDDIVKSDVMSAEENGNDTLDSTN